MNWMTAHSCRKRTVPNRMHREAVDGKVITSNLARELKFMGIWGSSCGTPFYKDDFCERNLQWEALKPYLHDRISQPWTTFSPLSNTMSSSSSRYTRKIRKNRKNKNKKIKVLSWKTFYDKLNNYLGTCY